MGTRERRVFLAILLLAVIVRLAQALVVATISGDAPTYIAISRHLSEGNLAEALRPAYPPLYSALVVAPYAVLRDWVLAGRATSFVFGVLTVAAMYLFTRRRFGERPAAFVALLLVFQPLAGSFSVRIVPSSVYTFLLVCSLWLGLRALETRRAAYWLGCGCVAGLGYLARPEALAVVMITGAFGVVTAARDLRQRWGEGLRNLAALAAGALVVMSPYVIYMRAETGVWRISKKKSAVVAVMSAAGMTPPASDTIPPDLSPDAAPDGQEPPARVPDGPPAEPDGVAPAPVPDAAAVDPAPGLDDASVGRSPPAVLPAYSGIDGQGYLKTLAGEAWLLVRSIGPAFLILIALALVRRRAAPRDRLAELYFGVTALLYLLVYALFYVSDRHLAPLMPLCVLWAGIGLHEITAMPAGKAPGAVDPAKSRRARDFRIAVVLVVIASVLPFALRPQDRDKICQKKAGLWLHQEAGPGTVLLTDMSRLAFYAQAEIVYAKNRPGIGDYDKFIEFVRAWRPEGEDEAKMDYVAVDSTSISDICHNFFDGISADDLIEVHSEAKLKSETDRIILYKVVRH